MSLAADLRAVVRGRDFRRLYATRLVSQTADGMVTVGLTSFVFFSPERHATAADARRRSRRCCCRTPSSGRSPVFCSTAGDAARSSWRPVWCGPRSSVLVAVLVAIGYAGPGFYAAGLAVLSVNRFFLSALSAALPHVVPRDELVMANSVSTTSGTIAAMVGGVAGFAVRSAVGEGNGATAGLLVVAASICTLAALAASRMAARPARPRSRGRAARGPPGRPPRGRGDGRRRSACPRAPGGGVRARCDHRAPVHLRAVDDLDDPALPEPLQRQQRDRRRPGGLALAVAASGAGFLLAAVLTPEATPRHMRPGTYIVATFALAAVAESFYVVGPVTEPSLLLGAFVLGFVAQGSKICVDSIVQTAVDDGYRGRVFSFYDVLFNVSFVSAAVAAILVVPTSGFSRGLFGGLAVGYALAALGYGRALRSRGGDAQVAVPKAAPAGGVRSR
jgi:hypothetical protein